ncbi:envelope glycoprotein N [Panine betaherpesvirus 2]|uniref:Envelope glycoprotein N n=1 Tax=Panine betaherpesvirus 2 TaxID=188763 RepID=Q8QS26_9BETA|nr:envelope glycoprotein N [Panine betaherpesvirus 2]AAM00712.1 envelope glycoprotein N [Panine betaherpesvirus 2]QXV67820.1 envelope glycoprotein N [Panine betaherpesvirus 2]
MANKLMVLILVVSTVATNMTSTSPSSTKSTSSTTTTTTTTTTRTSSSTTRKVSSSSSSVTSARMSTHVTTHHIFHPMKIHNNSDFYNENCTSHMYHISFKVFAAWWTLINLFILVGAFCMVLRHCCFQTFTSATTKGY